MPIPDSHYFYPYAINEEDVLDKLHASERGLTDDEAARRVQKYGRNALTGKKKNSAFKILLDQFKNSLTIILLGTVALIFFIYFFGSREQSDLIEAGLILAIVLMITILGFVQEFKAEKALDSLKKMLSFKAKVRRNGIEKEIDVRFLAPGDVVILEEGLKVPADIRLLKTFSLFTNESSLTGESTTVEKQAGALAADTQIADQKNMAFAGTGVTSGRGEGVIVRTGDYTEIGKIAKLIASEKVESTPLQKKLDEIGRIIGYIVIAVSIIVFVFIAFIADDYTSLPLIKRVVQSFIAAVALAVAAIPEGLPAVVTIALAMGTQRMAKRNVLVRRLSAVESLGAVDVICTDKTGTLTKNEMTVRQLFFNNHFYTVTGTGFESTGQFLYEDDVVKPEDFAILLEAGYYCNNASIRDGVSMGDPTEVALLISAQKAKIEGKVERVLEVPFSSERKLMSVIVRKNDEYILYAKGAPEIILTHSTHIYSGGKDKVFTDDSKKDIIKNIVSMNSSAYRTLGFGYKKVSESEYEKYKDEPEKFEQELVFIGVQGMIDPPREDVAPLIAQCRKSGIRVVMITGDHEETARAVAEEIGIDGKLLSGSDLERMSDDALFKEVDKIGVYARINPSSKMRIVDALKRRGHRVAMTGDGVNDAPALKKADIGIAMGITGTDVAKEAASIILLDDKFSTIVNAIEEGRGIYQNIRKFVQYLLSCNIGEVVFVFVSIIFFRHLPLSATMLLWINVVTDGLPAVALAMDRPRKDIVTASPQEFQKSIITRQMWKDMIYFAVIFCALSLGLYAMDYMSNPVEARSAVFIATAFFEIMYLFIIRQKYGVAFLSNKWLLRVVAVTILLQIMIVYVPVFAALFEVKFINWVDWLYIAAGTGVVWFLFSRLMKSR